MNNSNSMSQIEGGLPNGSPPFNILGASDAVHGESRLMKETLGDRLRAARENVGWTPAELARQSGVSKAVISRVEGGGQSLSLDSAAKICDALDLSLDQLAGRTTSAKARSSRSGLTKAKRLAAQLMEQLQALK